MYSPKGKTRKKTEVHTMKKITKKEMKNIAKEYGIELCEIEDKFYDMEGDGILVTAQDIEDMILNDDFY